MARQREVSRAVRAYVDTSEARRREEHGAGPSLDELIRRKKVCTALMQQCYVVLEVPHTASTIAVRLGLWLVVALLRVLFFCSQPPDLEAYVQGR